MQDDKLEKLLNSLADETAEAVPSDLADKIKTQIPQALDTHRRGLNTIRIIIDLRVGRLAAAAVIILTIVLSAGLFSSTETEDNGLLQDSVFLVKYIFGVNRDQTDKMLESIYDSPDFFQDGREVIFYGISDNDDLNSLIMHWELAEGKYRVIYSDWRSEVIDAEKLIKLQADMLQEKAGKNNL